jgi:nitroreductase
MIELVRRRRSIRSYTPQPVDSQSVELLVETLLRAPTSRNNTPWHFIVVDDGDLLHKLSAAKQNGSAFLKGAPLGIVVCADSSLSDVWVEDCAIASILVQMTALSLGLGSCWIQIRKRAHNADTTSEAYIQKLLGLPAHISVESIIAVGHPAEQRDPLPAEALKREKVHHNHYSLPFP